MELEAEILDNDILIVKDNEEEEFKNALANLLFAFKDIAGDSEWLSVATVLNHEKVCLVIALNEKAIELETLSKGLFNEDRTGS